VQTSTFEARVRWQIFDSRHVAREFEKRNRVEMVQQQRVDLQRTVPAPPTSSNNEVRWSGGHRLRLRLPLTRRVRPGRDSLIRAKVPS
jgi:hypothetical protein